MMLFFLSNLIIALLWTILNYTRKKKIYSFDKTQLAIFLIFNFLFFPLAIVVEIILARAGER